MALKPFLVPKHKEIVFSSKMQKIANLAENGFLDIKFDLQVFTDVATIICAKFHQNGTKNAKS